MDQPQDFKSLQDQIQAALVSTSRTTNQISSEDLAFQRSLHHEVGAALDEQSKRVLDLASALLKSAASISELRAPTLQDTDDVENDWRSVVDIVDSLLEKTDASLDEYTGVTKPRVPAVTNQQLPSKSKKQPFSLANAFRTQNLVKPQLAFDVKPDNHDSSPWKPLLATKPHATQPLDLSLEIFSDDYDQQQYKHPYETELSQLNYPDHVYQRADPIPYLPIETTSATFIDTEKAMLEMLDELKAAREVAVDLEHHDARSFVGLVSLMQISTREKDWIVDTLKPWRQKLQVLNEVFADPNIVKVFHGAYMDIVWLQRDLGLYIVGLFDTFWASRTLGYEAGSLAYLLKRFIDFDADKKYQLADWRIRPLPDEMFFYARADTHFLLYIYDEMRNELINRTKASEAEENYIEKVLQKSRETSLQRYERQVYKPDSGRGPGGWYSLLTKTPVNLSNEQFAVYRAVHQWRDEVARADDDSTAFVMPNHIIFSIAKIMPMDMVSLLKLVHPISYSVKSRSDELLDLVKSAKARGSTGPSMIDVLRLESTGASVRPNLRGATERSSPKAHLVAMDVDSNELRSESSVFWGGTFGSSVWDPKRLSSINDSLKLAVPLPPLNAEIFAQSSSAFQTNVTEEDSTLGLPNEQPKPEEPFVIKRGAKRRGDVISEAEETGGSSQYDIPLNEADLEDESQVNAAAKAAKKAEKKRKKAEKKAAEMRANSNSGDEEGTFDYSKAQSVLHGKDRERNGKTGRKPFDPYKKSQDAEKGMRRVQKGGAGKSATFKS